MKGWCSQAWNSLRLEDNANCDSSWLNRRQEVLANVVKEDRKSNIMSFGKNTTTTSMYALGLWEEIFLRWHYSVRGPSHAMQITKMLTFVIMDERYCPKTRSYYPGSSPPCIFMLTPSGRFVREKKI